MHEPTTTIDARFSDQAAAPTAWQTARRALVAAELFWLTTVRADSRPHVTPLVAVWLDGAVHFTTGAGEQKAVNLQGNARVVLATGCDQWDRGLDVVVEGDAVPVTDDAVLARLAEAWATKWDGRGRFAVDDGCLRHEAGTALVFAVRPTKVLAFGKGTFSQTRYDFGPREG